MSGGKVVAWLIEWNGRRVAHLHNAVGDYRGLDPNATSTPLVLQSDLAAAIARAEAAEAALRVSNEQAVKARRPIMDAMQEAYAAGRARSHFNYGFLAWRVVDRVAAALNRDAKAAIAAQQEVSNG